MYLTSHVLKIKQSALLIFSVACAVGVAGCGGGSDFVQQKNSFLYCTNAFSYNVSQFKIAANGALTTLAPNINYSTNTGGLPGSESLVFDPSHKHAYLANLGASTIDEFTVNANGSLSKLGVYTMEPFSEPSIIVFGPTGKFAYATSESSTNHKLTEFKVNADGTLSLLGTLDTGNDVGYIVLDPKGRFLYVTSYFGNTISRYPLNADGTVSAKIDSRPTGAGPFAATLTPSNGYLYVTNLGSLRPPYVPSPGTVDEFRVNADGSLTSIGSINTGTGPGFLTIPANGRVAYVGNLHDTTVMTFSIQSNGLLSLIQTLTVGNGPVQITMSPNNLYAYIAVAGANFNAPPTNANTIVECNINPDGTLVPFGSVATGIGPDFLLTQAK